MALVELAPGEYLPLRDGPDRVAVTFRLMGERLNDVDAALDDVTQRLGITPAARSRARGRWRMHSDELLGPDDRWFETHVKVLLDQLEPVADPLREVIADYDLRADFFVGLWMGSWNSVFGLDPSTMTRLASLNLKLDFDVYASDGLADSIVVE